MAEISFYLLPVSSQQERLDFACKLIEKIYRSGLNCYVLTDSVEQSESMDKLLWTFRPGSFIPHQLDNGLLPELSQTILIGNGNIPESRQNLVVNLSENVPPVKPETERILEILDNSESSKQSGRQRYRYYQQLGLEIVTHKL